MRKTSLEGFLRDPVNSCVVGRTWMAICAHPGLMGVVCFDRTAADEVRDFTSAMDVATRREFPSFSAFFDSRHMTGFDLGPLQDFGEYLRARWPLLGRKLKGLAIVRQTGTIVGAFVAGYHGVFLDAAPGYPLFLAGDLRSALRALGEPADDAAALVDEIEETLATVTSVPATLRPLRVLMRENLALTIPQASHVLHLSERTLQRRLSEAGTSFRRELMASRRAEAERRLVDTDSSITQIAHDLSFSSLARFSAWFRACTGMSAREFRERGRE